MYNQIHDESMNIIWCQSKRFLCSSNRVSLAREGLIAVIYYGLVSSFLPGSTLYIYACHPRGVLPVPGLAGCPVNRGE
jgi:hypothetical protein